MPLMTTYFYDSGVQDDLKRLSLKYPGLREAYDLLAESFRNGELYVTRIPGSDDYRALVRDPNSRRVFATLTLSISFDRMARQRHVEVIGIAEWEGA
jgi:hypothetical protein